MRRFFVQCGSVQLATTIRGVSYRFASVKEVLAKANPPKSGDDLAGDLGARCGRARRGARGARRPDARASCARTRSSRTSRTSSRAWSRTTLDDQAFRAVAHLTVGQFREWLLDIETTGPTLRAVAPGLTPEMAAAACKLMSNFDLMTVGAKCQVVVRANNTLGLPGPAVVAAASRTTRPTTSQGILASTREGLSYGCGDAVIGVNPATDTAGVDRRDPHRDRRRAAAQRDPDPALRAVARHGADEGARRSAARWT